MENIHYVNLIDDSNLVKNWNFDKLEAIRQSTELLEIDPILNETAALVPVETLDLKRYKLDEDYKLKFKANLHSELALMLCPEDVYGNQISETIAFEYGKIERMKKVISRALNMHSKKSAEGEDIKIVDATVGKAKKKFEYAIVDLAFILSDTQTITIAFFSSDSTPNKLAKTDYMVAYRFFLNKKDITNLVAPVKGVDLPLSKVAANIMGLAADNSAAFKKRADKKSKEAKELADLQKEKKDAENRLKEFDKKKPVLAEISKQLFEYTDVEAIKKMRGYNFEKFLNSGNAKYINALKNEIKKLESGGSTESKPSVAKEKPKTTPKTDTKAEPEPKDSKILADIKDKIEKADSSASAAKIVTEYNKNKDKFTDEEKDEIGRELRAKLAAINQRQISNLNKTVGSL